MQTGDKYILIDLFSPSGIWIQCQSFQWHCSFEDFLWFLDCALNQDLKLGFGSADVPIAQVSKNWSDLQGSKRGFKYWSTCKQAVYTIRKKRVKCCLCRILVWILFQTNAHSDSKKSQFTLLDIHCLWFLDSLFAFHDHRHDSNQMTLNSMQAMN